MNDLQVSRITAAKYLNALVEGGFLVKHKMGRAIYYVNAPLYKLLTADFQSR
jgi:Fic family protein